MSFLGSTATVDGTTTKLDGRRRLLELLRPTSRPPRPSTSRTRPGARLQRQLPAQRRAPRTSTGTAAATTASNGRTATIRSSVTAKDASGNTVAVSTEVRGTVDSVDLTQTPPTLKIGGQSFTLDKIKQVVRPGI